MVWGYKTFMLSLYLMSVILFFALIGLWLYKDRKKIDIKYYILFTRRTKRFSNTIDKIAKKSPRFWKAIATIAILVCFYYMFQGTYLLLTNSYQISLGNISESGLKFVLPSPTGSGANGPGYILVPFWFWIITIACVLVPHELSHGIIARAEKIRLKSVGVLLLAILPGAFVEPDEKQLKKAKTMPRLRVFAAGSGANFLVAALVFLLVAFIVWPGITSQGIELIYVNQSSPAAMAGMQEGMILTHVNEQPIKTTYQEYISGTGYLSEEIGTVLPGDIISFTSDEKTYDIELGMIGNGPYMGIIYKPIYRVESYFLIGTLIPLLTMIWLFSFAIGVFNILPLYPLDGGLMIEALADRFSKNMSKHITRSISIIIIIIILFNFIGPSLI